VPYKSHVLYIFTEIGNPGLSKIGTCSKGGRERFREGCFMNPRGLDIAAMWKMNDAASGRLHERTAHKLFTKLEGADGKEWFMVPAEEAIEKASLALKRPPDFRSPDLPFSPQQVYSDDLYDEFREKGDRYKGRLVQRRLWLHQEANNGLCKVSHNTWWCEPGSRSTNAKRTTYNTRRLAPISCLAFPVTEQAADWESQVIAANQKTLEIWDDLVNCHGIPGLPAGRVGWTATAPQQIIAQARNLGLVELSLNVNAPPKGVKSLKFPDH
jgi:hypothetical protein